MLDPLKVRADFPLLSTPYRDRRLVYLDTGVSAPMPKVAIDRVAAYESWEHTNVHRGVSTLSQQATDRFEEAREQVRALLHAASAKEIVWTRGTTEAINLVVQSWGRKTLQAGDEILLSAMEHHANIVSWQLLAQERGATIRVIPMNDRGELVLDDFEALLTDRTRIVGVTHVSNVLGTINPVKEIIARAHAKGVPVLVDGAQAVPHMPVDVQDLDADFYVFSGHKIFGPTGIGVLYAKKQHLDAMPPWHGGGSMILSVSFEQSTFMPPPARFEAGTPPIAQAIGLGTAIQWLRTLGLEAVAAHEHDLVAYATEQLEAIEGLRLIGTARQKAGVMSFVLDGIHPHDIGSILDSDNIVVRAGHHCAQPVMKHFRVPATTRASFGPYTTREDIDLLVAGILKVKEIFS